MSFIDRIVPLCDVLLGAAHADTHFNQREREEITELLADLSGAPLSSELERRIAAFDPEMFDLGKTAAAFRTDSEEDRRRLLFLVAAVNDADDEVDFAEDDYLRALCKALGLPDSALEGMTVDVELESLREEFERIRKGPPPPPNKKA